MAGRNVHFIGIGGVGMAGLAVLVKARGADVSGCDLGRTPRTAWLEAQGIPVAVRAVDVAKLPEPVHIIYRVPKVLRCRLDAVRGLFHRILFDHTSSPMPLITLSFLVNKTEVEMVAGLRVLKHRFAGTRRKIRQVDPVIAVSIADQGGK